MLEPVWHYCDVLQRCCFSCVMYAVSPLSIV